MAIFTLSANSLISSRLLLGWSDGGLHLGGLWRPKIRFISSISLEKCLLLGHNTFTVLTRFITSQHDYGGYLCRVLMNCLPSLPFPTILSLHLASTTIQTEMESQLSQTSCDSNNLNPRHQALLPSDVPYVWFSRICSSSRVISPSLVFWQSCSQTLI